MTRPFPSFAPFIRPASGQRLVSACIECSAPGPHAAELFHLVRIHASGQAHAATMASTFPLCPPCVERVEVEGWPALPKAWREINEAPAGIAMLARAQAEGGAQ